MKSITRTTSLALALWGILVLAERAKRVKKSMDEGNLPSVIMDDGRQSPTIEPLREPKDSPDGESSEIGTQIDGVIGLGARESWRLTKDERIAFSGSRRNHQGGFQVKLAGRKLITTTTARNR